MQGGRREGSKREASSAFAELTVRSAGSNTEEHVFSQIAGSSEAIGCSSMSPEAATHIDAISARVHAMGAFHGTLYRKEQFGEVELRDYAESILQIERTLPVASWSMSR
jgi:two-component sensor histidine kinase